MSCFTVRSQDPKYADAIAEMMDRIKSGTALRSGNQKRRVGHLIYSIEPLVFLDLPFFVEWTIDDNDFNFQPPLGYNTWSSKVISVCFIKND